MYKYQLGRLGMLVVEREYRGFLKTTFYLPILRGFYSLFVGLDHILSHPRTREIPVLLRYLSPFELLHATFIWTILANGYLTNGSKSPRNSPVPTR